MFYFTKPGDPILDPMAGGGVVPDVCLLFERKCQSFDLVKTNNRQEIQYHYWDPQNLKWPTAKKPDLIFFDPPYYSKKKKEYEKKTNGETPSISSYSKEAYESFLESFFLLAHQKSKARTRMAFLNADWPPARRPPARRACSSERPTPRRAGF